MANASVVFASLTGNNEQVAEIVANSLKAHDIDTELSEISQTDAFDLEDKDFVVLVPYTYGEGDLPEEGMDFYDDLADSDFGHVTFGVTGSGDTWYKENYCKAVTDFDQRLAEAGGTRGVAPLFIELSPDEKDTELLKAFVSTLVNSTKLNK